MPEIQKAPSIRRGIKRRSFTSDRLKVILINDDVTTFDFVIRMLIEIFFCDESTAMALAVETDTNGQAEVGTYPADIAKSKVSAAIAMARSENFPLQIITQNA
ncbi:MAG: ATP-dependent Clp protease adaptor ClpS [Bacteroidales bacterium]|nr:ATP-dependent Clp protease adaptor ClpS [Bacteroidales bacterium]